MNFTPFLLCEVFAFILAPFVEFVPLAISGNAFVIIASPANFAEFAINSLRFESVVFFIFSPLCLYTCQKANRFWVAVVDKKRFVCVKRGDFCLIIST